MNLYPNIHIRSLSRPLWGLKTAVFWFFLLPAITLSHYALGAERPPTKVVVDIVRQTAVSQTFPVIGRFVARQSGMVASLDGERLIKDQYTGNFNEPEKIGKELAKKLKQQGAEEILSEIFEKFREK